MVRADVSETPLTSVTRDDSLDTAHRFAQPNEDEKLAAEKEPEVEFDSKAYEYVDHIESVAPDYICSICHDVMQNPILLPHCGHAFCKECITQWVERDHSCPNRCDGTVDATSFGAMPAFFRDGIDSIQVYCPINHCKIERRNYKTHVLHCPRYCPKECGQKSTMAEDETHAVTCGGVEVTCGQCNFSCRRQYIGRHKETCDRLVAYEQKKKSELEKQFLNERIEREKRINEIQEKEESKKREMEKQLLNRNVEMEKREKEIQEKEERLREGLGSVADRITLNVGGEKFYTTKQTLVLCPFFSLFGQREFVPDDNGEYFLDRDPDAFRIILKYLRSGGQIKTLEECGKLHKVTNEEIMIEKKYFMLNDVVNKLNDNSDENIGKSEEKNLKPRAVISQLQLNQMLNYHHQETKKLMLPNVILRGLYFPSGSYTNSQFPNSDLSNCVFAAPCNFNGVNLTNCNLSHIDFSRVDLANANLTNATVKRTTFSKNLSKVNLTATDLSKRDFSDGDFTKANLTGVDLTGSNLNGANFTDSIITGAKLSKDLSNVNFTHVNLSNRDLSDNKLSGTNFFQANLNDTNLTDSNINGANFMNSKLTGSKLPNDLSNINFTNADLSNYNFLRGNLEKVNLSHANLSNTNLCGVNLSQANLSDANLSNANLKESNLDRTNFTNSRLTGAKLPNDLSNINFTNADLSNYNFFGGDLEKANLSHANLSKANLCGVSLSQANLSKANLSDANLSDANLSHANLKESNLKSTDLRYARLNSADLRDTDLMRAKLSYAKVSGANFDGAKHIPNREYGNYETW